MANIPFPYWKTPSSHSDKTMYFPAQDAFGMKSVIIQPWQSFWKQPASWRRACLEAAWLSAWARVSIVVVRFSRIAEWLGDPQEESERTPLSPEHKLLANEVRSAIEAAARRTPWKCECLVKAIVARLMLVRRGLSGTLYFGMRNKDDIQGEYEAHAWTRSGDLIVTGADQRKGYAVLSTFKFGPGNK